MDLQQLQVVVDRLDQAQLRDQAVHRREPTVRGRLPIPADLVGDFSRGEHRRRTLTPVPRQPVARRYPTPPACRVPPTLVTGDPLHRKAFPGWVALES